MKCNSLFFLIIVSSFLFIACAGNGNEEDNQDTIVDLNALDTGNVIGNETTEIIYLVSTPGEIVEVLNEANLGFKEGYIHNFEKADNYLMQASQALNLGIYSTDLAYCAYYDEISNSAHLFVAVQSLCKKMEISYLLESVQLNRVKNNLHSPDSIKVLSKEYNKKIYDHFIENDKENILTLISFGGFVESLYLATNSIDKFDPESDMSRLIAEQKYTFEVIRDYIEQQKEDNMFSIIADDIKELNSFFSEVKPTQDMKTTVKNNDGKIIIGGKNNLLLKKDQFKDLKALIAKIRTKYTNL